MANSDWVADVAEADFERDVVERSKQVPVVVDFWAPWCAPCRALGPVLEKLVNDRAGAVVLAKINVDEAQELAATYRIEGIPSVKAFRDGKPILQFEGVLPEEQLRSFLDRLVPSEVEKLVKQAAELTTANPAEAEKLYRQVLVEEPRNTAAQLGLVGLLLARNQDAEAADLLDRIVAPDRQAELEQLRSRLGLSELGRNCGEEAALRQQLQKKPDDAETLYQLGCVRAAAGQYPEALEHLLAAGQRDKKLAGSKVKEAMVKVFHIIGVRSDMADEYRDKLTKILY